MDTSLKAIIIGSGVAGMASAIRLAVQGFDVTVFEKNSYPGGKLSAFELNGYRFDSGPSLFTQPVNIEELFALAKEPIEDYFHYEPVPISCNYFYEDGTCIHAFADTSLFENELIEKVGEKKGSLYAYLKRSENIYKRIGKIFLNFSLHKSSTLWNAPIIRALRAVRWPYLFHTLHEVNKVHFSNPKTIQLFNRYATYNGSNPYQAPGMLSLIPHLEHNEGVFYPKGGMISITEALYKLACKKGVVFQFNNPVDSILHEEKKVKGVVVNGVKHYSDVVVSNMDIYFTYHTLLHNSIASKKILKQERSSSALVFYWGIKKEFSTLGLHNILFTKNYLEEFTHLFKYKKLYLDPTVYINITGKYEPGIQAPHNKENWFVMVNAPANIGQDWEYYRKEYRKAIIQKINRLLKTDIEPLIEIEEIMDPEQIEMNTASYMGSLYGTSSNSRLAAFLRHPNFTNEIKGLYFVGGSVHPGGGIPLCLKSAKIMSEIVKSDLKKNKSFR